MATTAFIALLVTSSRVVSTENSVFVQTGDSVQLDVGQHKIPEFYELTWKFNKSVNILTYNEDKSHKIHNSYKNRVHFSAGNFSLTLKNMQKSDSGVYTVLASGNEDKEIKKDIISVIDAVEVPALTVLYNHSSSHSCTVNFTCRGHDLTLNSTYQNNRCSDGKKTSGISTLILTCTENSIICNYSNPVSWKNETQDITQFCGGNRRPNLFHPIYSNTGMLLVFAGVIVFCGLVFCCWKKKGAQLSDDTNYDDVETLVQMSEDTWTTIIYHTVGEHQKPSFTHD